MRIWLLCFITTFSTPSSLTTDFTKALILLYSVRCVRSVHGERTVRERVLARFDERLSRPAAQAVLCTHAALPRYLLHSQDQSYSGHWSSASSKFFSVFLLLCWFSDLHWLFNSWFTKSYTKHAFSMDVVKRAEEMGPTLNSLFMFEKLKYTFSEIIYRVT